MWRALAITLALSTLACGTAEAQPEQVRTNGTTTTIDWPAVIRRQQNERIWWAEVVAQQKRAAAYVRLLRFAAAVEANRLAELARRTTGYGWVEGIKVCDAWPGDFPCRIIARESGFNPRARNSRSSAGGLAQMLNGTFGSICPADRARYGNAANAPVAVQARCYRALWAGGRGSAHWRLTR